MRTFPNRLRFIVLAATAAFVATVFSASCAAATLCVNTTGVNGCYDSIQNAVNHAADNDVIMVAAGTYNEDVVIGRPLSLLGAGAGKSIIDATDLDNGFLIDGYDHPGLHSVVVSGFTVENAQFEGILAVSATQVTIANNTLTDNDASPGLGFIPGALHGCPGQPAYETDETGDCGGAIHLIGVSWSTVSGNTATGNADGLLISDETAISQGNRVFQNKILDNPLDCGIVLASHPPVGFTTFPFRAHYGIVDNTITKNDSENNGVGDGAGVGLFSDGAGQGLVSGNVISNNRLIGNGIAGVAMHSHVGPAFGLPADDFANNTITGNYISGNGADEFSDTATPGTVGININSGGGGSPIMGTNIGANVITNEDVDIAINTPAIVKVHTNNLLGGNIGVANICTYDGASICTGTIDATQNYWGCSAGPNGGGSCSTVPDAYDSGVTDIPWLSHPVAKGHNKNMY